MRTYGIFALAGAIWFMGCNMLYSPSLRLDFTVKVTDPSSQVFDIELLIRGAPDSFTLRSYLYQEHAPVEQFEAWYVGSGVSIGVENIKTDEWYEGSKHTGIVKTLKNSGRRAIKVSYRTRVGTKYRKHGQQPYNTYGYMCDRFALVSGRNLFLLPTDSNIDSVRVRFLVPDEWKIAVPWNRKNTWHMPPASPQIKEELANTSIALGLLESRSEIIGDTRVSTFVYRDWSKSEKQEIFHSAFSTFRSVHELFGGGGKGNYTFNFVPKTLDGLAIYTSTWTSSQGIDMMPPTSERWLACAEKLMDRWIRYPPFRMTYDSPEDYWILDAMRRYYAIRIGDEVGWLDGRRYLQAERLKFTPLVAEFTLQAQNAPLRTNKSRVGDVRSLYTDDSWNLKKKRQSMGAAIMEFMNAEIRKQSNGRYQFSDVVRYQYSKRHGLNLLADIQKVVGEMTAKNLKTHLHDLTRIPKRGGWLEQRGERANSLKAEIHAGSLDTLRILITGGVNGHIEHCGCKVNQNGGITRRATVIAEARKRFPELLLIDIGNMFTYDANKYWLSDLDKAELKTYLASMDEMGYDLGTVSFNELYYGHDFFRENATSVTFPFVCANVLRDGLPIARPFVTITKGQYRLAILGIFQEPITTGTNQIYFFQDRTAELTFLDPIETIQRYLPSIRESHDFVIITGVLSRSLILNQIANLDGVDIVVSRPVNDSRLFETDKGLTTSSYVESGFLNGKLIIYENTSLYAIDRVDLLIDGEKASAGIHRHRTDLSEDIEENDVVREMIDNLYSSVITTEVEPLMAWETRFEEADFVGVNACKSCHFEQHEQWKTTSHASAFNTLLDARRHYQPECVVCHVTGMGHASGYMMGDLKHSLVNVQCEMCHGPGSNHIKNPGNVRMIRTPKERLCTTCHDAEHSDFDVVSYYPRVSH